MKVVAFESDPLQARQIIIILIFFVFLILVIFLFFLYLFVSVLWRMPSFAMMLLPVTVVAGGSQVRCCTFSILVMALTMLTVTALFLLLAFLGFLVFFFLVLHILINLGQICILVPVFEGEPVGAAIVDQDWFALRQILLIKLLLCHLCVASIADHERSNKRAEI